MSKLNFRYYCSPPAAPWQSTRGLQGIVALQDNITPRYVQHCQDNNTIVHVGAQKADLVCTSR